MTEKQPQTCYILYDGFTQKQLERCGALDMMKPLPERYVFTKEELKAYVKDKEQDSYWQGWDAYGESF